jgi:proline iminopeptidase
MPTARMSAMRTLPLLLLLGACAVPAAREPGVAPIATDTLLEVNGTRLFVHLEGAGAPAAVIHGGPLLDHGYIASHLAPLGSELELIFYDQRLSGRSAGGVDSASIRLDTFVADSTRCDRRSATRECT